MKTRIQNNSFYRARSRNAAMLTARMVLPFFALAILGTSVFAGQYHFAPLGSNYSPNDRNTANHLIQIYEQPGGIMPKQQQIAVAFDNINSYGERSNALRDLSGAARANMLMMGGLNPSSTTFERLLLRAPEGYYGSPMKRGTRFYRSEVYQPSYEEYDQYGEPSYAPSLGPHNGEPIQELLDPADFGSPERIIDSEGEYIELDDEGEDYEGFENFEPTDDFGYRTRSPYRNEKDAPVPTQEIVLFEYFGQCATMNKINFWANPFHNIVEVDGDWNSHSYDIRRTGVLLGGHQQLGKHSAFGVVFGYSDPVMSQHHARATANDYQIGFYGGTLIKHRYELKGYIGFGHQEYTLRRTAEFGGFRDQTNGRTDGHSFAMSFQLSRPFHAAYFGGLWKPHIAIDMTRVDQDGFIESGDSFGYFYQDASLDRTFFRLGVSREIDGCDWRLRAGLGYSALIGGDDTPTSSGKIVGATGPGFTSYGADTDKDYFNGNVGLEWFLNRSKTSSVFSDYQIFTSKRETNQTVSLGFRWMM